MGRYCGAGRSSLYLCQHNPNTAHVALHDGIFKKDKSMHCTDHPVSVHIQMAGWAPYSIIQSVTTPVRMTSPATNGAHDALGLTRP